MATITSPMAVYSEIIGSLNNGEALEMIQKQREVTYNQYLNMKKEVTGQTWTFTETINKFKLVLAYDILIESFEKYLGHNK